MRKQRLLVALSAAIAMVTCVAPMTAMAATGDTTNSAITVAYDNRNVVIDPENPDSAKWGVSLPVSVIFTDTKTSQNVDVELVGINGFTLAEQTDTLSVDVKVTSTNGMKMQIGTADPMDYSVTYGGISLTGTTSADIATLTKAAPSQTGTARLTNKDQATQKGAHTDILTYTVGVNAQ